MSPIEHWRIFALSLGQPLDNIWVWVNGKKRRGHYNEPWYVKDICVSKI